MTLADRLVAAWYSPRPTALAVPLLPLALLFRLGVASRRMLYRVGVLRSVRLRVPVVVVGNITVGGSGKTPLVAALALALSQRGFHPGIVSRGYGRDAANGEPLRGRSRTTIRGGSATSRCCSRVRATRSWSPTIALPPDGHCSPGIRNAM